jgi:PIN domain nuclease of toxin-antitoxin system
MHSMTTDKSNYLLDTHVWLWLAVGDLRISAEIVGLLEKASSEGRLHMCQISLWELAMKEAQGKIKLSRSLKSWILENTQGISIVDMPLEISIEATRLPGEFHKDPADRIIVATARHKGFVLVTGDGLILKYAQDGNVAVLPLRV